MPLLRSSWAVAGAGILAVLGACKDTTHAEEATHEECVGFVVASDGRVALSELVDAPSAMDGMDGGAGMMDAAAPMHDGGDTHADAEHLHGTCIAISADKTAASATTQDGTMRVSVASLRGMLTADAPDHEGLSLSITSDSDVPVTGATVVLVARMPHHDHTVAGGHGPKNDFEAAGMAAVEQGDGRYVVDPIDFQMTKFWFFEARISKDGTTRRAYFAMEVAATGG